MVVTTRQAVRTVSWLVLVVAVAGVAAGVLVPRMAGATPYTVLTGSMAPALAPGTLAVVRPVEPAEIAVGDVVTYQLRSGEPGTVTHRVVGVSVGLDGERALATQGDANDAPDPAPVRPAQVRGELWYAVPHLGRVGLLVDPEHREAAVRACAALLFAHAAWLLVAARRDGRGGCGARVRGSHRALG